MAFSQRSRARLTAHDIARFPGDTLFHRLARAVCAAGCLPRKELFESWEVARRIRRHYRGGRIVDVGGGHGLLAHALLLLDDTSSEGVVVDVALPPSSHTLQQALTTAWPRLAGRITLLGSRLEDVEIGAGDLVVSSHACGTLTDRVLDRAVSVRARVAVLPCCHDVPASAGAGLSGWLDGALALDVMRAMRLERHGYRVRTQQIPDDITPKNRLLLGAPISYPGALPR